MARSLRIEYEGAWYHIMNRGLGRQNIFLNDNHKKLFLDLLLEVSKRLISAKYPILEGILHKVSEIYKIDNSQLIKNNVKDENKRRILIYLLMINPRYKISEKARLIGITGAGFSKNYKSFLKKIQINSTLFSEVKKVEKIIYMDGL